MTGRRVPAWLRFLTGGALYRIQADRLRSTNPDDLDEDDDQLAAELGIEPGTNRWPAPAVWDEGRRPHLRRPA